MRTFEKNYNICFHIASSVSGLYEGKKNSLQNSSGGLFNFVTEKFLSTTFKKCKNPG